MKTVSAGQMREMDKIAELEFGIPSILLMENASVKIAEFCFRFLKGTKNPEVLIICGSGNNGGDGTALARHLHVKGIKTHVVFSGDINSAKGDAAVNYEIIRKLNIPIEFINHDGNVVFSPLSSSPSGVPRFCGIELDKYDLIIDAVFGTGLTRDIEGSARQLIEAVNRYAKYVISVDMPSGIHSDTGKIMGGAVKADETVTLGFPKKGLYLYPGYEYAGIIHIEDIAIPPSLIERIETKAGFLTDSEAVDLLPVRKRRSNKGDCGRIFVFAGSDEMPGAASMACSAAYMTGGGLVRACVTQNTASVIQHWQREVVTRITADKNGMYCKKSLDNLTDEIKHADVIVLGPGIGRSPDVTEFVFELLKISEAPVVIDADALFAVSENVNILKEIKAPCVITPHPGEMSRLAKMSVSDILDDIAGTASRFSGEFNVVTLLKDAHTIIAGPDGQIYINTTGNNALSKAGTGDVLTGMIAGFIAQGSDVFNASVLGAYFHGKSCEKACLSRSRYSVIASDIIENISAVMGK